MTANDFSAGSAIGGASGFNPQSVPQIDAYWGSCDCCTCLCVSAELCFKQKHKCCQLVNRMGVHECSMR